MRCPFEGAILSGRFGCQHAEKFLVAHREGIVCGEAGAFGDCEELVEHLTENAAFGLRLPKDGTKLTHGQEMKVRVGGLVGLMNLLSIHDESKKPDVSLLVQSAKDQYDHIREIPFAALMPTIQAYKPRERSS